MDINYRYQGENHQLRVHWTEGEESTVFRNILKSLSERHRTDLTEYGELAERLDQITDSLYKTFYITPEDKATSYNPLLPKRLHRLVVDLEEQINLLPQIGMCGVLFIIYRDVLDSIKDMVGVFIEDNRYQGKYEQRSSREDKHMRKLVASAPEEELTQEFEDLLVRMTDIASLLNRLTETQRRRLVQHIFLGYSMRSIATMEGKHLNAIQKSITGALKIMRTVMESEM